MELLIIYTCITNKPSQGIFFTHSYIYFNVPEMEDWGAYCFWSVCLSLTKFNLANNLWTVSARIFIFHIIILSICTKFFDLDNWPIFVLRIVIGHIKFLIMNIRTFILHMSFCVTRPFYWDHNILAIEGILCFTNTSWLI